MKWLRKHQEPGWLAIRVDADRVAAAHVRRETGGRPRVTVCDSWEKAGSDIDALSRLGAVLKAGSHRCTTVLPLGDYQLLLAEPPAVPSEELKSAIRWRIKDMLDYPVDEATLDVLEIPSDPGGGSRGRAVFAVAAPNRVIEARVRLFQQAGVPLATIDVQETAQRNLAALYEAEGRGIAALSIGPAGGMLTFTRGGELYMTRRIDIASRHLEADGDDRYQLLERLVLELQRSLDNFEHQYHFVSLARLIVLPLAQPAGVVEYLAQNLYLPVEAVDLGDVLDIGGVPELRATPEQSRYLDLLGAALRDESAPDAGGRP